MNFFAMALKNKQIETALLQFESICQGHHVTDFGIIRNEFEIAENVAMTARPRATLYELFHSLRGVDTALRKLIQDVYAINCNKSMGAYLIEFSKASNFPIQHINSGLKVRFQNEVVDERNRIMHGAGVAPNRRERDKLMGQAISLLQVALACQ